MPWWGILLIIIAIVILIAVIWGLVAWAKNKFFPAPKKLGESCAAHTDCAGWGPGSTAVACCGVPPVCTQKMEDWAGIGYCPNECRACPAPLCAPGTCGQPNQHWPRLEGETCNVHTDCLGWGPGTTDTACCAGVCQRKQADWAGVGYCPTECKACPTCPAGTCGQPNQHWPRLEGETCNVHTDCLGWGPGPDATACCAGICQRKQRDWAGVGYCPSECRACPAPLCEPGSCGRPDQHWPRLIGETCNVGTDCANYGTRPGQAGCCQGVCQTLKADWANVGYCPAECKACPTCSPGTCGQPGEHWPREQGETCNTHSDCRGWVAGKVCTLACCQGVCTPQSQDYVGVGYCPNECKGGPFLPPGTCSPCLQPLLEEPEVIPDQHLIPYYMLQSREEIQG
jgi:hypothetical protein